MKRQQTDTDAACKMLSDVESRFRAQETINDRDFLGLRILQRVVDYIRDPVSWARSRNRMASTPTSRFWEVPYER